MYSLNKKLFTNILFLSILTSIATAADKLGEDVNSFRDQGFDRFCKERKRALYPEIVREEEKESKLAEKVNISGSLEKDKISSPLHYEVARQHEKYEQEDKFITLNAKQLTSSDPIITPASKQLTPIDTADKSLEPISGAKRQPFEGRSNNEKNPREEMLSLSVAEKEKKLKKQEKQQIKKEQQLEGQKKKANLNSNFEKQRQGTTHYQDGEKYERIGNYQKAIIEFKKAAKIDFSGKADALYKIGLFYEEGRVGEEKSNEEAKEYYDKAAELGHAKAKNRIGIFYHEGRGGLTQNLQEAKKFYKEAGYAGATFNLGLLHEECEEYQEAVDCYKMAIHEFKSEAEAMYRIGSLYQQLKQINEAKDWLKKAVDKGHEEASKALKNLENTGWLKGWFY